MDNFPLQIEIEEKKEALTKNKTISDDIEYTYFYSSYSAVSDSSTSYFSVLTSHLSEIGRFTQEDPVLQINENSFFGCGAVNITPIFEYQDNPEALNPYLYVLNNPVNATDITGEKVEVCTKYGIFHRYIKFKGGPYSGETWGFRQRAKVPIPCINMPAKVVYDEPLNSGGRCFPITKNNSFDRCVWLQIQKSALDALDGTLKFNICFHNCKHWTRDILHSCGISY